MRVNRECRNLPEPPRIKKPLEVLFPEGDVFQRTYAYPGRNIVKENIRQTRLLHPRRSPVREVPPFSTQTLQRNTRAVSLPVVHRNRSAEVNTDDWNRFRLHYDRGDLPVRIIHGGPGEKPKGLRWISERNTMAPDRLHFLLPMFALGLPIIDQPYRFVAERGMNDLLDVPFHPAILIDCMPDIVRALRAALYSFDAEKKRETLKILIRITRNGPCGPALVPFYRQLLPPLRTLTFSGLRPDIAFQRARPLEECIEQALHELERTGGPTAYINIKYIIPTYDSCTGAS